MTNVLRPYSTYLFGTLRIVAGYAFALHGAQKLFGVLGSEGVPLFSFLGFAGVIEFFGGALIAVGLFTRPVAVFASGEMAAAYFIGHVAPNGAFLFPVVNRGELAVLYCFLFLYIAGHGPGAFSLDGLRRRSLL